ncbi:hypothetical protein PHISCL_07212 [Aspergillus sclerotialis]|uniref:Extracellular serine-rich protein n=1 Tax=Aspergillus sclerotialis TaxID=2070753 RepID=A0A3A2ZTX0_9EURO|nr:hypothetical protein PHISCL_07212 [Aspergillus sclerotialis]
MLALVSAQTSTLTVTSTDTRPATTTSTHSSTTSTGSATHTVKVGPKEDPHQYVPHNITADVGDVIVFEFYPTNHSVVKADYMAPCVPASGDIFYSGAFDSFNEENGQLVGPPPTWSLVVNDTEPTFFYCTAIDSCMVNGMVGVINPNSSMTFKDQYDKAKKYPYMLVPGQSMPAEGEQPDSPSSPTSTPTKSPDKDDGSSGLSGGAIAGIVVGVVAFVAILVALFFVLGRNRVYKKWMSSEDGRNERTARWALFNAQPEPWATRRSEMDGTTQPPGDQTIYSSSPDPAQSGFSPSSPPQQSGRWSTKFQHQAQFQQPTSTGPSELEATSVVPNYQDQEMRGVRF